MSNRFGFTIENMKLYPVDASRLKSDSDKQSLWFRGEGAELYITITENEVVLFEISLDQDHLEGGLNRSLKHGIIEKEEVPSPTTYKASRLVKLDDSLPQELIDKAINLVFSSVGLEQSLREGIMLFLSSKGKDTKGLINPEGFKSFRNINASGFKFTKLFQKYGKNILWMFVFFAMAFGIKNLVKKDHSKKDILLGSVKGDPKEVAKGIRKYRKDRRRLGKREKLEEYDRLCSSGSYDDCYMAMAIRKKMGQKVNLTELDLNSCSNGYAKGCYSIGMRAKLQGELIIAIDYLKMACDQSFRDSCKIYNSLDKTNKSIIECEKGHKESCYRAAEYMYQMGNYKNALKFAKAECQFKESDNINSCTLLGKIAERLEKGVDKKGILSKLCLKKRYYPGCASYIMSFKKDQSNRQVKQYLKSCQTLGTEEKCLWLVRMVREDQP